MIHKAADSICVHHSVFRSLFGYAAGFGKDSFKEQHHIRIAAHGLGFRIYDRRHQIEKGKGFPLSELRTEFDKCVAGAVFGEELVESLLAVKIVKQEPFADRCAGHDLIGTGVPVTADCKYFECAVDHAVLSGFFEIPEFFVHLTDLRILT